MLEKVSKDSDGCMPYCPRDVQQLYDLKAQMRTQPIDPYENSSVLMAAEGNDKYIRRVTNTPESHSIRLYMDNMVDFMQRHCGFGNSKSPIHVDTTYDLTNGNVVLCTLRAVRCQGSPLIHCYQKSSIFDAKRVPNGVSQNMGLFLRLEHQPVTI